MIKHKLEFKNRETPGSLDIDCIEFIDDNGSKYFHVEIWDTDGDYHSFKPFEDVLKSREDAVESLGKNHADYKEEKSNINYWRRYKNKRYKMNETDLLNMYTIIRTFEVN
jgi:hypothetical protein